MRNVYVEELVRVGNAWLAVYSEMQVRGPAPGSAGLYAQSVVLIGKMRRMHADMGEAWKMLDAMDHDGLLAGDPFAYIKASNFLML